jgi:hypothetical protein
MSRRGRGHGGRSRSGTARIGGVEIAYDDGLEESMKNRVQPMALFPVRDVADLFGVRLGRPYAQTN